MANPSTLPTLTLRPALKHHSTSAVNSASFASFGDSLSNTSNPLLSPPISSPPLPGSSSSFFPRTLSGSSARDAALPITGYKARVGFDTFGETNCELFSFTLQAKSDGYVRTKNTRVYLCAASADESGQEALDWALDSLCQDGDELVVLRGFDGEGLAKDDHEEVREEARELLKSILERNSEFEDRKLSICVEFVAGKITETIERLVALYRPDSLIVGTRGRTKMKAWGAAFGAPGMGSVSRWCVSHSPVPVIVVRPERKVKKSIDKRRNDPKRAQQYEKLAASKAPVHSGT